VDDASKSTPRAARLRIVATAPCRAAQMRSPWGFFRRSSADGEHEEQTAAATSRIGMNRMYVTAGQHITNYFMM